MSRSTAAHFTGSLASLLLNLHNGWLFETHTYLAAFPAEHVCSPLPIAETLASQIRV